MHERVTIVENYFERDATTNWVCPNCLTPWPRGQAWLYGEVVTFLTESEDEVGCYSYICENCLRERGLLW